MKHISQVRPEDEEGADLEQRCAAVDAVSSAAVNSKCAPKLDYFIHADGEVFAGRHLIVDLYDAGMLDNVAHVERALVSAARVAGATVLSTDFHHFQPNGGVSGVVVLAESHISIHTWPEAHFAAADIFMCGACAPERAVNALQHAFAAGDVQVRELRRGRMPVSQSGQASSATLPTMVGVGEAAE